MRPALTVALLWIVPAVGRAQAIHGVVVDPADRPVGGVVMVLLDTASAVRATALTNERGEFRLAGVAPGRYRIRSTRIGFRPFVSAETTLKPGEDIPQRIALTGVPFTLDTVRAASKSACRLSARDSAATTFAVWEQIQAALNAAEMTAAARAVTATTINYDRTVDFARGRVVEQTADARSEVVKQPWRSMSADVLHRTGYVADIGDSTTYRAPGLEALLSTVFLEDHCLRLSSGDNQQVGIAFEPTPDRKDVADIRGTIWVDRKSSELRSLAFTYTNVSPEIEKNSGGEMQFARIRNGAWVISRWNIRMPVLARVEGAFGRGYETRITYIKVSGGELALVTAISNGDTLWSRPPLVLTGAILDSISGKPIRDARVALSGTPLADRTDADGRFTLSGVLPGNYVLHVGTPSLDSVHAINESTVLVTDSATSFTVRVPTGRQVVGRLCGNQLPTAAGIVIGTVSVRGDTALPARARVVAEWTDISLANNVVEQTPRVSDAQTDATGTFTICGLPVNTSITIRATTDSAKSAPVPVRIPAGQRFERVNVVMDRAASGVPAPAAAAIFTGVVLADTTHTPIANAEVSLPELSIHAVTSDSGAFTIAGVPAGEHQVLVRRIGYGSLDTRLTFIAGRTLQRTVYLNRVVTLDSVLVNAASRDREMDEFAANKNRGFGHFFTRADLEKLGDLPLASVMQQTPGVAFVRGPQTQSYIIGTRAPMTHCKLSASDADCLYREGLYYVPDRADSALGIKVACYSQVYLDRMLANPGRPTGPFDLHTIPVGQVEAIEWYADGAQVPSQYYRRGSECGVMVIHTRR